MTVSVVHEFEDQCHFDEGSFEEKSYSPAKISRKLPLEMTNRELLSLSSRVETALSHELITMNSSLRKALGRPFGTLYIAISISFIIGFILLMIFLVGTNVFYSFATPSEEQGIQRAEPIIAALETYRQGWGKHPNELQQLVPDFLNVIPTAGWHYPFYYKVCRSRIGYVLYFQTRASNYCDFLSEEATWSCKYVDSSSLPFFDPTCLPNAS